jgi:hypothetical protein
MDNGPKIDRVHGDERSLSARVERLLDVSFHRQLHVPQTTGTCALQGSADAQVDLDPILAKGRGLSLHRQITDKAEIWQILSGHPELDRLLGAHRLAPEFADGNAEHGHHLNFA